MRLRPSYLLRGVCSLRGRFLRSVAGAQACRARLLSWGSTRAEAGRQGDPTSSRDRRQVVLAAGTPTELRTQVHKTLPASVRPRSLPRCFPGRGVSELVCLVRMSLTWVPLQPAASCQGLVPQCDRRSRRCPPRGRQQTLVTTTVLPAAVLLGRDGYPCALGDDEAIPRYKRSCYSQRLIPQVPAARLTQQR